MDRTSKANCIKKLLPSEVFRWFGGLLQQKVSALYYHPDSKDFVFSEEEWHTVTVNSGKAAQTVNEINSKFKAVLPEIEAGELYVVEFDGGTSCNNPSKGFGIGYGSFQINGGEIQRVKFGSGHSSNSAEIMTLTHALEYLGNTGEPKAMKVLCRGDSQIALKWVTQAGAPKPSSSEIFRACIPMLRHQVQRFQKVQTQWRGRKHSVALFGH